MAAVVAGGYSSAPAEPASATRAAVEHRAASAPAAPQVVSVTLHNDCPNTVKLFLGEKPKFGSGTNTSLGSNTTTSYQMKPGDMIWITDDSENGLSSTSIGGGIEPVDPDHAGLHRLRSGLISSR